MFEDGIGIVRSYVDEFEEVCENGLAARAAEALRRPRPHVPATSSARPCSPSWTP